MKYLLIVLALVLFSCSDNEMTINEYEWRWNMQSSHIRTCTGFENNPVKADYISIMIESDLGEIYNFSEYSVSDNQITLYAPERFQTDEFNDPELIRVTITLTYF